MNSRIGVVKNPISKHSYLMFTSTFSKILNKLQFILLRIYKLYLRIIASSRNDQTYKTYTIRNACRKKKKILVMLINNPARRKTNFFT